MTVERDVSNSRQQVWDVLADGWTYSQWWWVTAGCVRSTRTGRPRGAVIRHSIGTWPAVIDDETVVQSSVPLQELVLLAKEGRGHRQEWDRAIAVCYTVVPCC